MFPSLAYFISLPKDKILFLCLVACRRGRDGVKMSQKLKEKSYFRFLSVAHERLSLSTLK